MENLVGESFWKGRRVFLTGHTGFKGGWMALWLNHMGAQVRGYALDPSTDNNLFGEIGLETLIEDVRGDIRDGARLEASMSAFKPEVVFHLAAQPLVRYSYQDPIGTYETNVIGTAKVLDAVRRTSSVRAVVSVTTDKCYENREWIWPYRETDPLGGYDPYSSSKACAEIVSGAFRSSYFPPSKLTEHGVAIATARAGNVIGGGDWSVDRLIPDLVRSFLAGDAVRIRSPHAIRPWQHVLEPVHGYLLLAQALLGEPQAAAPFATAYNFGPSERDARPVSWIVEQMIQMWGDGASWVRDDASGPHEANYLRLDSSRAQHDLSWSPKLNLRTALEWLIDWYKIWDQEKGSGQHFMREKTLSQIGAYSQLVAEDHTR